MAKKITYLLLWLFSVFTLKAQQIHESFDFFEVDALQQIYLVKGSQIKKYSPDGNLLCQYQQAIQGSIYSIDVKNPLKILVFFKEAGSLVYLDKFLSEITEYNDLYANTGLTPQLACTANDGNVWVFDLSQGALLKIDDTGRILAQSQHLSAYKLDEPFQLLEKNSLVFLVAHNKVLAFDQFAAFLYSIPLAPRNPIQIEKNQLFYFENSKLINYHLQSKLIDTLLIHSTEDSKLIKKLNQTLYLQTKNSLQIEKGKLQN